MPRELARQREQTGLLQHVNNRICHQMMGYQQLFQTGKYISYVSA
jgi:hypothetical protein